MGLNRRYIHSAIILAAYIFLLLAVRWTFLLKVVKSPGAHDTDHNYPIRVQRDVDETLFYEPRSTQPVPQDQISAPPLEPMVWPEVKTVKRKRSARKRSTRRRIMNTLRAVFTNFMHP